MREYYWNGEALVPLAQHAKWCRENLVEGEVYQLEESYPRSWQSHKQYFATIKTVFDNLPEDDADLWQNPEELRQWALIAAGYADKVTETYSSKVEAIHSARITQRLMKRAGIYCTVDVNGHTVTYRTARSNARKAMTSKEFQECKERVFDVLGKLIGVPVEELRKQVA